MRAAPCALCVVRPRAICAASDQSELRLLERYKGWIDYERGADIFREGEPLTHVGNVVRGFVKLTKTLPDGRRQMLSLLAPADFLGRVGQTESEFSATAATEVTLCRFPRDKFEILLENAPMMRRRLLERSYDELDAARDQQMILGRKSAREKVASFLLFLARRGAGVTRGGVLQVQIPVSRADIADFLGLTIETVSRQLTRMRGEGVIRFTDTRLIEVAAPEALWKAASETSR